jgi:LPXTG-site transpeptidase (sortase) family protein
VAGVAIAAGGAYATYLFESAPTEMLVHAPPRAVAALPEDMLPALAGPFQSSPPGVPVPTKAPAAVARPVLRQGTWLEIPALDIALPVERSNLRTPIPFWKAFVFPGTSWPGQRGNSYVFAHGIYGMFGSLIWAHPGQAVYVHDYDTHSKLTFHVSRVVGKVAWNDYTWLLQQSDSPLITLQTCVDYNPQGDRWVVQVS